MKERARAEKLWRRLRDSGDPATWKDLVLDNPEFQSWAFCEKLCNESAELADDDTEGAFLLADLALELFPLIPGDEHLLSGIQEYIWKHLGNVFRARGELKKAREAFDRAGEFFLTGILGSLPSLILRDRLSALESALYRDQGDLGEALRKISDAAYHSYDPSCESAFFLEKARLHRQLGQPEEALQALWFADRKASDARLLVRLAIERGGILCDLGRPGEVKKVSSGLRETAEAFPLERVRLLCLEGRVAAGLGRVKEAKSALRKARAGFDDRSVNDLARLSLELAALLAREGQTAELKRLAGQTLPLAESPGLVREAAATLKLFCRLAEQEKLSPERAALFARDFSRIPVR